LRFEPSESFDVTLAADYFHQDDHAYSFHYLGRGSLTDLSSTPPLPGQELTGIRAGGTVPADLRDSTSDSGPDNRRTFWGLAANARLDLGWAELFSVTGYRSSDIHVLSDLDVTSARLTVYDQFEDSDQFSQELRLAGEHSRGDWMIGAYYFDESIFGGTRIPLDPVVLSRAPTLPPLSFLRQGYYGVGRLNTKAYALFGSTRFELTDQLAVRLGARYSDETKKIDEVLKFDFATPFPPFVAQFPTTPPGIRRQLKESWSSFTPSATIEYKANDDLFFYATYAKGFKSGGFNLGVIQPPFEPEKITDYEAGIRADWLDGRLRTNLSAFYYDYTNLQVTKIAGTVVTIENAASAVVRGLEAEIVVRPTNRLRLDAAISLLDSEYRDYASADPARPALGTIDVSGNQLTQAPDYTINLNASYTMPTKVGDFTLRGEGRWVDRVYFTQFNLDHVSQPAYSLFNAFLSWQSATSGLRATAFIRNIGNKDVISAGFVGSSLVGSPLLGSFEPPRTYGLTLGWTF
jgi:iron complex outermembrane receptor protein